MKTIGLIGGMSWESSGEYYRLINEGVRQRLGGLHSAKCVLVSVDFAEIEPLQSQGRWEEATGCMIAAARQVEAGGADFVLICTNTMHKMAGAVQQAIHIPLLHIADAAAEAIKAQGLSTVGLLGTRYTMEEDFYRRRLEQRHGLNVITPGPSERDLIDRVIFDELCLGKFLPASRSFYAATMEKLAGQGAQGILLACTEIGLLVDQTDSRVPLFDTTRLHAQAAVDLALEED